MDEREHSPALALRRLVNGYQVSQALHVAATLGIADLLANGARDNDDLAAATGTQPRALYRLLRALASVGVLHERDDRRFALTPLGDSLRSNAPESVTGWAAYIGEPYYWNAWAQLLHSVRSGENAFQHHYGVDVWAYRTQHPELLATFNRAMSANTRQRTAAVLAAYDFSLFTRLVDVGGGRGAFLAAALVRHPRLVGVLFDLPAVVVDAVDELTAVGVADRCRIVGGSFFDAVPANGDAYLLGNVLHDWDDVRATAILQQCRRALRGPGTLLVVERELLPPNAGVEAKFSDLNMLVDPGGQERTTAEYAALFAAASFRLLRVVPTAGPWSIFEGVPVEG
ncbi:MAG: methyltransferase [Dehalococcoidia bacterium]